MTQRSNDFLESRIKTICKHSDTASQIIAYCKTSDVNDYDQMLIQAYRQIAGGEPPNQVLEMLKASE